MSEEKEESISLGELLKLIDTKVMDFTQDLTSLIPISDSTSVIRTIIFTDIIAVKEKAKMAINSYVLEQKSKQQGEENAESNKED